MKTVLNIGGMTCASCASHVTQALRDVQGVEDASVNLATECASVFHDASVPASALVAAVESAGYEARADVAEDVEQQRRVSDLARKRRLLIFGIFLCVPVVVLAMFVPDFTAKPWILFALTLAVWGVVGWEFHRSALASLRHGTATMDTLVSLGSTAALLLSSYEMIAGKPTYFETASAIVTLVFAGKYLEALARVRSSASMRSLLDLRPTVARRKRRDGTIETVPADAIERDDVLVIAAGERIPVDGIVASGTSSLDRSMLTGESMPVDVVPGDALSAGTLNGDGALEMRATAVGADTELARILEIVRNAQGSTPPVQRLADRISSVFVPVILVIALATLAGWLAMHHTWTSAVIAAVAVLVVACPCALGLATPSAIVAGVGAGARRGLLFKDAGVLERASAVDTVIFDKTGTLTAGIPRVIAIHAIDGNEAELLRATAAVERASTHPLADAIVREARDRRVDVPDATDVHVVRGGGIAGNVGDIAVLAGNAVFMREAAIQFDYAAEPAVTRVYVARAGELSGWFDIADTLRENAADIVSRLRAENIDTLLVSGDAPEVTRSIARAAGIDRWYAQNSPVDKAEIVKALRDSGRHVAFIGDGINDAPALAVADVGFAMGGGTAAALESAGAAILSNDPGAIPGAIELARATMVTIKQNLFWAFAYNAILVPLAAFGIVTPMFAAAAMGLSSLFVVGNSLRLAGR